MRPTLYAVLSDIHANFQALQAVAQDAVDVARDQNVDSLHFIVLGDVVDYGPQPNECMEWVSKHAEIVIQGNHDLDVAHSLYQPPKTIQPKFWPITIWTRMTLMRTYKELMQGWPARRHIQNQNAGGIKEFTLFHSSLTSGHQGYIDNPRTAWDNLQLLRNSTLHGLFGHSHVQGYFVDNPLDKRHPDEKTTTMIVVSPEGSDLDTLTGSQRWFPLVMKRDPRRAGVGYTPWADMLLQPTLLNPGGLGQSRPHGTTKILAPHDNRASYLLLKSNGHVQFQFRRTPYDVEETIRRLREDVKWPPLGYANRQGSDILKGVESNPFPAEVWQWMKDFRQTLNSMEAALPALVENELIPQLR